MVCLNHNTDNVCKYGGCFCQTRSMFIPVLHLRTEKAMMDCHTTTKNSIVGTALCT